MSALPRYQTPQGGKVTPPYSGLLNISFMSNQAAKKKETKSNFFGDIIAELKKVTWLKWPDEVLRLTGLVLLVAVTVGAILGGIDYGFSFIVDNLIIGG